MGPMSEPCSLVQEYLLEIAYIMLPEARRGTVETSEQPACEDAED